MGEQTESGHTAGTHQSAVQYSQLLILLLSAGEQKLGHQEVKASLGHIDGGRSGLPQTLSQKPILKQKKKVNTKS